MIDLNKLIDTAIRNKDSTAINAYRSLQERAERLMAMPGPSKGQPLTERETVMVIREEIRDRMDANEFIGPTQSSYAANKHIVALLTKLLPR